MPQERVELIAAAMAAIRDGDRRRAAALFAPGAEWHNTSVYPGPPVYVGSDAIIDFWNTLVEDFDMAGNEIERVAELDRHVVVGFHQWGCGRLSGAPIDVHYAAIFELVADRIARVDIYGDFTRALEAAGLRE